MTLQNDIINPDYLAEAGSFRIGDRRVFPLTVQQLELLEANGHFGFEDTVELIFGTLLTQEEINPNHAHTIRKINRFFGRKFPNDEYELSYELPVRLSDVSQPKPDFLIAVFREDLYKDAHPGPAEILLIIEVAGSSLLHDRTIKSELYARAGIKEFWIVNLKQHQVLLHHQPNQENGAYARLETYEYDETLRSPLVGEVAVADLMDKEG